MESSSSEAAAATAKESAAASNAEEAADVAAVVGEAVAAALVAMQASNKRKFAAVALNAEEVAAVAATAGEAAAAAAAALQASKKLKFPREKKKLKIHRTGDQDLISRLPDDALGIIVSFLSTKEGARTQVLSRRWRPLWRSAPLNLVADYKLRTKDHKFDDVVSKILSVHPGPARRFSLCLSISYCHDKLEGWLSSQALDKLEEFDLSYYHYMVGSFYQLPSSVYRFAPTLRVAKFCGCHFTFTNLVEFKCLKQLTLDRVTISEDALQSMLSGCSILESLELMMNFGFSRLCISSQTLKSIGFYAFPRKKGAFLQEVVIVDAPCLERLLPLDPKNGPEAIRIISAPKLKIVGMLSEDISEIQFGTTVFQKMIAVGLPTKMHTIRVLVLGSAGPNLDAVVNFLKCFPCLETLYVIFQSVFPYLIINNVLKYDPLDPIECLELHLKKVVLKNYDSTKSSSIDFAKFFVLNAKVLMEMKITVPYHRQHNWFAKQRRLLHINDRASRDARIELKCGTKDYFTHNEHTHDLSMADPFDVLSSPCSKCS